MFAQEQVQAWLNAPPTSVKTRSAGEGPSSNSELPAGTTKR